VLGIDIHGEPNHPLKMITLVGLDKLGDKHGANGSNGSNGRGCQEDNIVSYTYTIAYNLVNSLFMLDLG
jgi:hypothetical protein